MVPSAKVVNCCVIWFLQSLLRKLGQITVQRNVHSKCMYVRGDMLCLINQTEVALLGIVLEGITIAIDFNPIDYLVASNL